MNESVGPNEPMQDGNNMGSVEDLICWLFHNTVTIRIRKIINVALPFLKAQDWHHTQMNRFQIAEHGM